MGAVGLEPKTPCNCQALRQAARQISQHYDKHLAASGLRTSQFSLLVALNKGGPQSIHELARAVVLDRTTLGRGIRPLERDGLVEIGEGPDGRTKALKLTGAGRKKLAQAVPLWKAAQKEFEDAFGASDAAALRVALERVVDLVPRDEVA